MTREEFKDWLFAQNFTRKITVLQNHHTWMPNYASFKGNNHFSIVKNMRNYHMTSSGFSEIAQQITTFPDGTIMIGHRDFNTPPAGIKGANSNGICMENIGNFDSDVMTAEHKATIVFINAIFCMKFNVPADTDHLIYHHWFDLNSGARLDFGGKAAAGTTKTCPGGNFFGGNTVDKANANFIPLVKQEIVKLTMKGVLDMFNDNSKIGDWAKPSVERLVNLGLIKGDDQGNFNPQNPITREQFAVVIDRLLKLLGK
jgi:hypothetical protein